MRPLSLAALVLAVVGCGDNTAVQGDAPTAMVWQCNGSTGLATPLVPCSAEHPCGAATTPFQMPECKTHVATRPMFDDGAPRMWNDAVTGEPRAACVFRPPGIAARPLVLWFHGAAALANQLYDSTSLRAKAAVFDLESDPSRPGFILVADQGQVLDNPTGKYVGPASRHDFYYRDLASPSTNPDFRNVDRLIDELVAEGGVDTSRIYAMGWSNGALFAQEYAVARHALATPGGHRVAAAVAYAGPEPFADISDAQTPSCAYSPLPTTDVPMNIVHRDCDYIATCDPAQQATFMAPPGFEMTGWLATLRTTMADPNVVDTMFDAHGAVSTSCAPVATCTGAVAGPNHQHWPDGIDDASGLDHEPALLAFLRDHPLP